MPGKGCLIRFKQSNLTTDLVFASRAEIHGEHLVFLRADGSLAALFFLELSKLVRNRISEQLGIVRVIPEIRLSNRLANSARKEMTAPYLSRETYLGG